METLCVSHRACPSLTISLIAKPAVTINAAAMAPPANVADVIIVVIAKPKLDKPARIPEPVMTRKAAFRPFTAKVIFVRILTTTNVPAKAIKALWYLLTKPAAASIALAIAPKASATLPTHCSRLPVPPINSRIF